MKRTCLLLPFTDGVDMDVLEHAVLLAKGYDAILVPLALIHVPEGQKPRGARLEHIQQAKDFLEAVRQKAVKYAVPIELREVFTGNVVQSIGIVAQQAGCDGLLLFVRGRNSMLLSDSEIECIIKMDVCTFYIVHLPAKENKGLSHVVREYLFNWLPGRLGRSGRQKREETRVPIQETYAVQAEQNEEVSFQGTFVELKEPVKR